MGSGDQPQSVRSLPHNEAGVAQDEGEQVWQSHQHFFGARPRRL